MTLAVNIAQSGSNNQTFRNRIINGAMVIDQRNNGAAVTGITNGGGYGVDRFVMYNQSSGTFSVQRVSDAPAGFNNSLRATVTTAGSTGTASWTSFINQRIEGFNIADLGGGTSGAQPITISFWVKASVSGAMTLAITNNADRTYVTTYTINTTNTWEYKTVTVTLPTSGTWNTTNGTGLEVSWGLGSGSNFTTSTLNTWQSTASSFFFASGATAIGTTLNATFQITGVQLEEGTAASPFEFRQYGTELALCQRYYQQTGTNFFHSLAPFSTSNNSKRGNVHFWVFMRATPTLSLNVGGGTITTNYLGNDGFNMVDDSGGSGSSFINSFTASAEL